MEFLESGDQITALCQSSFDEDTTVEQPFIQFASHPHTHSSPLKGLEMLVTVKEGGEWVIPGEMVNPGEAIPGTVSRAVQGGLDPTDILSPRSYEEMISKGM